ncbi:LEAF RUST 10 DISEASE-RESISTANCE LOCUS RECEPTOR-LIKE PROTEIN KINASE-like 2.4 [Syzygium oleosum]|uniref:LEAF RUST 10 DISEASE-RESISTANCE LOCUS RECEPTOR-LIKE PROTEIN KINASE-like 2.4 n=1 Tax=Syzygium oleosum TaxID=219896 RepID=UPI0011D25525|nr:LEAF RUST 10 DISEASE-RESISTANCE LOCUS RECEPTOR-LIKE PROTEIN KINASE-like 2.4 [Syzygium oleosum]
MAASGAGIVVTLILLLPFWKKPMIRIIMALIKQRSKDFDGKMKIKGLVSLRRYTYKDIKTMTNSFKEKLSQGGYGSVYKGKLRDGQLVALKLLKNLKGDAEEFFNEVASISKTSHVNVVSLLGFCFEGSKRALVYEFMSNGSLEKFIFNRSNTTEADQQLSWDTLYQISLSIAHGLEYLHKGCNARILHFDIKPHNILLDENYCPKISDFGLAKICPREESIVSMLGARGTIGYIAPELIIRNIGGVSHKSDVYSYGMMVLEMVSKRRNIEVTVDQTSETYFPHWVHRRLELREELGLHGITNEKDKETATKMIVIGLWCIQIDPRARPCMTQVVEMLKGSFDALQIPPKPILSSPSQSLAACPCESSSMQKSNDSS